MARPPPHVSRRGATLFAASLGATTTSLLLLRPSSRSPPLSGTHAVISLHVPFRLHAHKALIPHLASLVSTTAPTAAGLATALRTICHALLQPNLLADSSSFAPRMQLFVAQGAVEARDRFASHVATEAERARALRGVDAREEKVGKEEAVAGECEYGVVCIVVATEGVTDVGQGSEVSRIVHLLHSFQRVVAGNVLGLELVFAPKSNAQGLSKNIMSTIWPDMSEY